MIAVFAVAAGGSGLLAATVGASSVANESFGTAQILMVVAIFVLVVLSGFLAMAETALTRMGRIRAHALSEDKRRGSVALVRLVENPERWLNALLLLLLMCHLIASTLVGLVFERAMGAIGVLVGIVLEVVVIFIASEAGPKTYAVKNSDRAALVSAPVVSAIVGFPPIRVLSRGMLGLANMVLPGRVATGPTTSEQELLAMADAALDDDVIEREERSMIHSVIEFGDTVVREVMKPRPDIVAVDANQTVVQVMEVAIDAGYSRIPVMRESKDDIAGIVYAKDLMRALRDGRQDVPVGTIARPARFAPESKRVNELMREMQAQKFHMAIVLDEYGGTAGLVTLEDLIEELIGEIVDEYDQEEAQIERLPNGEVRVAASMLIDELDELLAVDWPAEDWDTVGGLLFNQLGHVASEGESVEYEGHLLRAEKVKGRRIGRVRITRLAEGDEEAEEI